MNSKRRIVFKFSQAKNKYEANIYSIRNIRQDWWRIKKVYQPVNKLGIRRCIMASKLNHMKGWLDEAQANLWVAPATANWLRRLKCLSSPARLLKLTLSKPSLRWSSSRYSQSTIGKSFTTEMRVKLKVAPWTVSRPEPNSPTTSMLRSFPSREVAQKIAKQMEINLMVHSFQWKLVIKSEMNDCSVIEDWSRNPHSQQCCFKAVSTKGHSVLDWCCPFV